MAFKISGDFITQLNTSFGQLVQEKMSSDEFIYDQDHWISFISGSGKFSVFSSFTMKENFSSAPRFFGCIISMVAHQGIDESGCQFFVSDKRVSIEDITSPKIISIFSMCHILI